VIGIEKNKDGSALRANGVSNPAGTNDKVRDVDSPKTCVQGAKLVLEWIV